jgi:6-phosphogluconolactonase
VTRLYIGTQTLGSEAEGIYRCDWDTQSGRFANLELAARAQNPTFAIVHEGVLLVVNELSEFQGEAQGAVSAYRVSASGLELRSMLPSHGVDPCHIAARGDVVAVANYGGGTVTMLQLDAGALTHVRTVLRFATSGPHRRQDGSHPHGVYFHDDMLLVPDLGGDCIHRLRAASGRKLAPLTTTAGSGPRHIAIAPAGWFYGVNELANTVDVYANDTVVQTVSTLPDGVSVRSSAAEILLNAAGDRLIASNRGHDSLVSWPVSQRDGRLGEPAFCPSGGGHPRHFLIDPSGWILIANRDGNNLVARRLEPDGAFGEAVDRIAVPAPVCIATAS